MSTRSPAPCPHELRPSTTVCLHCRSEARAAASARLRRIFTRIGFAVLVVAVGAVVANAGSSVVQERRAAARTAYTAAPPRPSDAPPAEAPPVYAARNESAPPASAQPKVAEGRTELRDSVFAIRTGNSVTVHFDTQGLRTRRRDKFEQVVRATLPEIYGPLADSLLAAIPAGQLTGGADLLAELPTRGIHLRAADGGTLTLYPETRPGRDGPLVVTYRATLAP